MDDNIEVINTWEDFLGKEIDKINQEYLPLIKVYDKRVMFQNLIKSYQNELSWNNIQHKVVSDQSLESLIVDSMIAENTKLVVGRGSDEEEVKIKTAGFLSHLKEAIDKKYFPTLTATLESEQFKRMNLRITDAMDDNTTRLFNDKIELIRTKIEQQINLSERGEIDPQIAKQAYINKVNEIQENFFKTRSNTLSAIFSSNTMQKFKNGVSGIKPGIAFEGFKTARQWGVGMLCASLGACCVPIQNNQRYTNSRIKSFTSKLEQNMPNNMESFLAQGNSKPTLPQTGEVLRRTSSYSSL